ncbi:MAG: hypothetical protein JJ891_15965 [Rhizobiaceae bacterium]|nr:hypothetical protein [Rhizobiaceae bacterium]
MSDEQGGGEIVLGARKYQIDQPIVLKTGVRLRGNGAAATQLAATPDLNSSIIVSNNAEELANTDSWFHNEGVPVRFGVSDLMIDGANGHIGNAFGGGCGMHLYGKGFEIVNVQISHMKKHGLVSVGSARGGQETWLDEPEAVFDVRISRCGGDGFLMRGPHDSIVKQAIVALCKGRGLAVETDGRYNGACDIEFCHAYGTEDIAIDLKAKVKAGFLQGDTGRKSGVRIAGSNVTYVDRIECFKTRGSPEDYALDIEAPFTQVGLARVRADWGTSGVRVGAPHCQIGQLDIDGLRNTGGPYAGTKNDCTALFIQKSHNRISSFNCRNFENGRGFVMAPGCKGVDVVGTTLNCSQHVWVEGGLGIDARLNLIMNSNENYHAVPSPDDNFSIREIRN